MTAQDAWGTVVPCDFRLTKNSARVFAIYGTSPTTAFIGSILAGNYSRYLRQTRQYLTMRPRVLGLRLQLSRCRTPLNLRGQTTSNTNFFVISGLNIVMARALNSADDGTLSTVSMGAMRPVPAVDSVSNGTLTMTTDSHAGTGETNIIATLTTVNGTSGVPTFSRCRPGCGWN
jgi:hypothetical protein